MPSLYDNTPDSVWGTSGVVGPAYVMATAFAPSAAITVTALRWYKPPTGAQTPSTLKLWDSTATTTPLVTISSVFGATGWNVHTLTTPLTLVAGREYRISGYWIASSTHVYAAKSSRVAAPAPAIFSDYGRYSSTGAGDVYPTTVDNDYMSSFDVIWTASGGGGSGGATPDQVGAELAKWLSSDGATQTHETDGLPWLTKQDTAALLVATAATNAILGTRAAGDTRTMWMLLGLILDYVIEHAEQITHILDWIGGAIRPPDQDPLAAILNRIDVRVEGLWDAQAQAGWADGAVLCPDRHTLEDTFPFVGQVGWGSGYALHRIHIDSSDDRHPMIDLGAAGWWVPGVGWWAPALPDGALGRRTPLEFADQWLWPVPSCATGIVVWVHPSVAGTLEAYSVHG